MVFTTAALDGGEGAAREGVMGRVDFFFFF